MFKLIVHALLGRAGIVCNGPAPWDPQINDERFYRRVLLGGSIGLGESYVEGWWDCADIESFVDRLLRSGITDMVPRFDKLRLLLSGLFADRQDKVRGKRVAKEHYDQEPEFFMDVLGSTNSYTCARWNGAANLDEAQTRKMDLICRKAHLRPSQRVLDIGCGWGGFLVHATSLYGVSGIGLSISEKQIAFARSKYHNLPIEFRLQDYRDFCGQVDAVVSICMIEHVGAAHYREYFRMAYDALRADGLFVLQCIFARSPKSVADAWLDKHIFPGGMLVTRERIATAVQGLFHILDEEYFGADYEKTLKAWYDNLAKNRGAVIAKYGLEHFRKYEYYFRMLIGAFRSGRITVGQLVLSPSPRSEYVPVR